MMEQSRQASLRKCPQRIAQRLRRSQAWEGMGKGLQTEGPPSAETPGRKGAGVFEEQRGTGWEGAEVQRASSGGQAGPWGADLSKSFMKSQMQKPPQEGFHREVTETGRICIFTRSLVLGGDRVTSEAQRTRVVDLVSKDQIPGPEDLGLKTSLLPSLGTRDQRPPDNLGPQCPHL